MPLLLPRRVITHHRLNVAVDQPRCNGDAEGIHLGLGALAVATTAAMLAGLWAAVPFLLLFEVGYAYTSLSTLLQAAQRQTPVAAVARAWSRKSRGGRPSARCTPSVR